MALNQRIWNALHRGKPSWDLGSPDPELTRVLDDRAVPPERAIDLGCAKASFWLTRKS